MVRKLLCAQERGSKEIRLPLRDKLLNQFILDQKKRYSRSHFSYTRAVFSYYLFKYFLKSFLSLSSFWDPIMIMLLRLMLSRGLLGCLHFFFHYSFCILFCGSGFHLSVFQVTYPFFCLSYSVTDSF